MFYLEKGDRRSPIRKSRRLEFYKPIQVDHQALKRARLILAEDNQEWFEVTTTHGTYPILGSQIQMDSFARKAAKGFGISWRKTGTRRPKE